MVEVLRDCNKWIDTNENWSDYNKVLLRKARAELKGTQCWDDVESLLEYEGAVRENKIPRKPKSEFRPWAYANQPTFQPLPQMTYPTQVHAMNQQQPQWLSNAQPQQQLQATHPKPQCSGCLKFGHTDATCWLLHPELRPAARNKPDA